MGVRKEYRIIYNNSEGTDKTREMMIASANYPESLGALGPIPDGLYNSVTLPRKKRKLDYLSPEEKLMYKKLKNREAAQNSRDKKKAYVSTLERALSQLQEENLRLNHRIDSLINENKELKVKNNSLEEKLRQGIVSDTKIESAVLITPLPKELVPLAVLPLLQNQVLLLMISCLILMASAGWMIYQTQILKNLRGWLILYNKKLCSLRNLLTRKRDWWGPYQKCWNPIALSLPMLTI